MEANARVIQFIKATNTVFKEMLNLIVSSGQTENEGDSFISRGATVIVGFTGGWKGLFFLDMSQNTALKVASILNGEDYHSVAEEEVLLSCAEVANVISGNAITAVNNAQPGLNIRLTPPSVFMGEDMSIFNVRLSSWSVIMQTDAGVIKINVAVEEGMK
ncbi:MAG: chemotaxis protein CheX [Desulfosporosinus sp.]